MIRAVLAFMLISGSAFAQIAVQGTIPQDNTPSSGGKKYNNTIIVCKMCNSLCYVDKNGYICNPSGTMPTSSRNDLQPGTMQPLGGIPLEQTQMSWGICGITPSGKCVAIKVDEDGRVIVSPDQKSDAYTAVYQKGYMMGFKNGSEAK